MRTTRNFGLVTGLIISAMALGGCAPSKATHYGKPDDQTQIASTPFRNDLRVMSFNIRTKNPIDTVNGWAFRRDLLVDTVERFNPDLLGTQECQATQANDLRESLPEYEFVGVGRNNGKNAGEMCGIFFKKERFTKVGEGHFWLSSDPADVGSRSWGALWPRMVSWVQLRPRGVTGDLFLFNTHFDITANAREHSARLLRQKIAQIAGRNAVVVTGDFNDGENSDAYDILVGDNSGRNGGLVDTFRELRGRTPVKGEGTRHAFRGGTGGERIDWILTSKEFTTLSAAIDRTNTGGRYPSDHFPVTAVLRLPPKLVAGHYIVAR